MNDILSGTKYRVSPEGVSHLDEAGDRPCCFASLPIKTQILHAICGLMVPEKVLTSSGLDDEIEYWFDEHWQARLVFVIDDDLLKLVRLQLVEVKDGKYSAVKIEETVNRLEAPWDSYFAAAWVIFTATDSIDNRAWGGHG